MVFASGTAAGARARSAQQLQGYRPASSAPAPEPDDSKQSPATRNLQAFWGNAGKVVGDVFKTVDTELRRGAEDRAKNAGDFWATIGGVTGPANEAVKKEADASAKRAGDFWSTVAANPAIAAVNKPLLEGAEQRSDNAANFWSSLGPLAAKIGDAKVRSQPGGNEVQDRMHAEEGILTAADKLARGARNGASTIAPTSRVLSDSEWAALTPEQQQGVITNFALYQASQADKAEGGSANTERVVQEFGLDDNKKSLDGFLSGRAITTLEDIRGDKLKPVGSNKRVEVFGSLMGSSAFDNESMAQAVASGTSLLESLRDTGTVSTETAGQLGVQPSAAEQLGDRAAELDTVLKNMANREVFARIQADPDTSNIFNQDFAAAMEGLDPALVSRYFEEKYRNFGGDPNYMTYEEFRQNWLA